MTRPTRTLIAITLLGTAAAPPAWADFRLQPEATRSTAILSQPAPASEEEASPAPRFKLAHGFGHDVPLGFAVRQIVPTGVTVQFGKGVDPKSAVTWTGEAPWNRVLAAAVRPLGMKITTGASTVLIAR